MKASLLSSALYPWTCSARPSVLKWYWNSVCKVYQVISSPMTMTFVDFLWLRIKRDVMSIMKHKILSLTQSIRSEQQHTYGCWSVITKTWKDKESPESGSTLHDHRVHFDQGRIHNCPHLEAFIKKTLDECCWNTDFTGKMCCSWQNQRKWNGVIQHSVKAVSKWR